MDSVKAAVDKHLNLSGHHDTTVHEKVAPAVTSETVRPSKHEDITTAVDREVHQDHHHTTVQPVKDREVLPEQHKHNILPVEHTEHHHGDQARTKERLEREAAQFESTRHVKPTHETQSVSAAQGEHVHHHVHETIQPVVHKETVQPSVVHTTVPVHEVHHNESKHHATSHLPAVSMAEFKQHGTLHGREERSDQFDGCPKGIDNIGHQSHGHGHAHGAHGTTGAGRTGASTGTGVTPGTGSTGSHAGAGATGTAPVSAAGTNTATNNSAAAPAGATSGPHTGSIGATGPTGTAAKPLTGSGNTSAATTGTRTGHHESGALRDVSGNTGANQSLASDANGAELEPVHSSKILNKLDPRVDSTTGQMKA